MESPQTETEAVAAFTQTGGARVGRSFFWSVNWTRPFATLEIRADALTLRVRKKTYQIPRAGLRAIRVAGPRWAPAGFHGVVIAHDLPQLPAYLAFWSFDLPALVAALEAHGYSISS